MMPAMPSGVFTSSPRLQPRYTNDPAGRLFQDRWAEGEHEALTDRALRNQAYYDGTQYDELNEQTLAALNADNPGTTPLTELPEHERMAASSGHIAECVDFIADQLTDGFAVECADAAVQKIIDDAIDNSELLANGSDEELAVDNLLVQAAVRCDVPFQVLWDPVEQSAYFEFWEPQQVKFDVPTGRYVRGVEARYKRWVRKDNGAGGYDNVEVEQREVYDLVPHLEPVFAADQEVAGLSTPGRVQSTAEPIDFQVVAPLECRKRVYWDGDAEDQPRDLAWLGVPFIPWEVLRVYQQGVYGFRGVPLVSEKAIQSARRFDANEQQAYITTRFNAHANLGVVGDQAFLQLEREPTVRKDLADVLRFPGGTALQVLQLPTDATMIEHTHSVTADAIYQAFGLTRVDPETIGGLGAPSGYSLEILNRRSEGKLKRVRRTFKTDLVRGLNMLLDLTAYRRAAIIPEGPLHDLLEQDPELEPDLLVEPVKGWPDIDPASVFPRRDIEIRMGSGYIVDDVQIRDDFVAGLISHQEALRQRGYSNDDIDDMLEEDFSGDGSGVISEDASGALLGSDGLPLKGQALVSAKRELASKPTDAQAPAGTKAGKQQGSTARDTSTDTPTKQAGR